MSHLPLKRVATIVAGQSPPSDAVSSLDDTELPFLQGNAEFGTRHPVPRFQCETAPKRAYTGDVLLSVRAPVGALNVADRDYGIGRGLCAIRPDAGLDPSYMWWAITAVAVELQAVATGSTYDAVSADDVGALHLPVPTLEEQRVIADYLDRETARIDALIAARRAQLVLVQERLSALLQHSIDDAKPTLLPLRRVVRQFVDYRGATPEKSTAGVPLVTATNVSNGRIDFSLGEQFVTEETYTAWMRRGFPEEGDVLLTTEAPLGEVAAIADARVALAQRLILLKPDLTRLSKPYLRLALTSPRTQADLLSRASGSTVWGIRADRLRDVLVPVPHLEAQRHIVAVMATAESVRASVGMLVGHQVKLLTERRQALITAAVTGELPVPVAA